MCPKKPKGSPFQFLAMPILGLIPMVPMHCMGTEGTQKHSGWWKFKTPGCRRESGSNWYLIPTFPSGPAMMPLGCYHHLPLQHPFSQPFSGLLGQAKFWHGAGRCQSEQMTQLQPTAPLFVPVSLWCHTHMGQFLSGELQLALVLL